MISCLAVVDHAGCQCYTSSNCSASGGGVRCVLRPGEGCGKDSSLTSDFFGNRGMSACKPPTHIVDVWRA